MGYTKLFSSIVTSTIWQEDDKTRIIWVTLLALSDAAGRVEGSIPGLAHVANVPIKACRTSLAKLMGPDADSRTKEQEGRRLIEIDGGWQIINYAKYREKTNTFDKDYYRIKQQEHREKERSKEKEITTTTTTTEAEVKKCQNIFDNERFNEFWHYYPKKVGKGKCEDWWKKHKPSKELVAIMIAAVETQKTWEQWKKADGQYIPMPATWLNQKRWQDEGLVVIDKRKEAEDDFERIFNERQEREKVFAHLKDLWPKWLASPAEKEEWGRVIEKMEEQFALTAITEFFQEYGRYDRPSMPDFLIMARAIWKAQRHQKKGVLFQIKRMSDGYCSPFMVYGSEDPEKLMGEACRQRDKLIAQYGGNWQVIRPDGNPEDCIALTKENRAAIDKEIMTGLDCPAKTFLIARYGRLMEAESKAVNAPAKTKEFWPDGEPVRYLSNGTRAPKRGDNPLLILKPKADVPAIAKAVNNFAADYGIV